MPPESFLKVMPHGLTNILSGKSSHFEKVLVWYVICLFTIGLRRLRKIFPYGGQGEHFKRVAETWHSNQSSLYPASTCSKKSSAIL
jgi:hypothetical protein